MNNHKYSISPSSYFTDGGLFNSWTVLSLNHDRNGREFVSTVEHKTMPYFGTQWHPEKNNFEWTPREALPHSELAVQLSQHFANFFVNECRRGSQTWLEYDTFMKKVIWNYNPVFSGAAGSDFTQIYLW